MKKILPYIIIFLGLATMTVPWLMENYDYPPSHEIKGFQYVEQPDGITCGPTSALMVLRRYGKDVTLDEVKSQTKTQWFTYHGKPIGMTSPDYVARAMRHFGVPAKMKHGNMGMLKHYVSQNRPVLCLIRSSDTTWHFVAVTGYDVDRIITADPGPGARVEMRASDFEGAWSFKTDMDGVPTTSPCPACKGTGRFFNIDLGPLLVCDVCGGSGRQPDYVASLLKAADVYPYTMIVPGIDIEE